MPTRPARRACQHAAGDCSVGHFASGWLTLLVSSEGKLHSSLARELIYPLTLVSSNAPRARGDAFVLRRGP